MGKRGRNSAQVPEERRKAWEDWKRHLRAEAKAKAKALAPAEPFTFTRDKPHCVAPNSPALAAPMTAEVEGAAAPHPLFVYEPADLNELSLEEVAAVWERRRELCGSLEAAAEVLAILRVAAGADSVYRGWRAYLNHSHVVELADELVSVSEEELNPALQVTGSEKAPSYEPITDDLLVDRREVAERNVRLRKGQAKFRDEVLAFHGGRCCITGCPDDVLLEAAHIAPYRGEHTNDVRNGLAMRVDIHRLFDRFLLAIEPNELVVRVSPAVKDEAYLALDGHRVLRSSNAPYRSLLAEHYRQFLSLQEARPCGQSEADGLTAAPASQVGGVERYRFFGS